MRAALRATTVLCLVVLSVAASLLAPPIRVSADPWIVDNANGTTDAVWNFTNAANYTFSNTALSGNSVTLKPNVAWWNSTTAADFAGPDGSSNVNLATWPGNVVLASTSGSSTLVTLQPGAAGVDAYLDRQNQAMNHGADTTMVLDGRGATTFRPILWFDLSSLPAGAVIDSAILSLYESASIGNAFTAEVHAVTAQWAEAQVTWNDRLTGTPWTTAGGDYDAHVSAQMALDATLGWKTANITALVDLWYRSRLVNNGLIVWGPNAGADSDKTFYSSEYAVDPTLRPKLDIRYRILGASGWYTSKVGGPGVQANWDTISWNATERSAVSDDFTGSTLDPKWTWTNPPASYDVGTTTPGSLHVVSTTGTDLNGATFTGNVLWDTVAGDFTATMKVTANLPANGQKVGLLVEVGSRDWYAVQETRVAGIVNWQVRQTADATTATPVNAPNGAPATVWFRIARTDTSFTASTSTDGVAWTAQNTYTPAFQYPLEVRIGLFVSDGLSGAAVTADVDYVRVTGGNDATLSVRTRIGNTNPVDVTWSAWSAAYATPGGSAMSGSSNYIQFNVSFSVLFPDHTPNLGDLNLSWSNYVSSGTVTTQDLVPSDLARWGNFTVVHILNGQSIAYEYSLDSGGSWTPVSPPADLQSVSIATGKIRFRAALSTTNTLLTPVLGEVRLQYFHNLDHFYVTAPATATAGSPFSVTVVAKDRNNATMTGWTGAVTLAARLTDGVTPGGGVLGTTSLSITSGGTATLPTETYTKAEPIRVYASAGGASGLSDAIAVSPGALARIAVTPDNVTLLIFDIQSFAAQAYDAWDNALPTMSFDWTLTGGVGSLNSTTGPSVSVTAGALGNGTLTATSGSVSGTAEVHVVTGTRPWIAITAPASGAWLIGAVSILYVNSSDAVSVRFEYDSGAGWTLIGTTAVLTGAFPWDTAGLNFTAGGLRGIVTNNRTITNVTVVTPINVDNAPPTISLGSVTDNQAGSGTLTLTYVASPDVVRVDLSYFDGTWHPIGSDLTIDGSFLWTPGVPINGVTVRAVAVDHVNLTASTEKMGVGRWVIGTNPPVVQSIPTLQVRTGVAYSLNLTFYVSDPDTALAALTLWTSDAANDTIAGGTYPQLIATYATAGTYPVTLWVSDGTDTAFAVLTIVASANNPPALLRAVPTVAFDENTTAADGLGGAAVSFFNDPDGEALTVTVLGASRVAYRINGNGTVDFWAPNYWFGTEALRLQATDPSGAFAEGGFLVVVRNVDQPPSLDAIPVQDVTADQATSLDLTPFIHDVDTALASLTVTVDSPYVTVQGHTLILNFPAAWAGTGFNVTLSDGTTTVSRFVQVSLYVPPAAPPWWQAPYILAIPPVGLLVVIGMFVQRQRFRPAKAFLVDERGQMLREFTLDPSCAVTYEQVQQAGALDARDKDIKVSKYHARTVQGDALAIVLLAYGPVNLQEVEFAREMLVNIQDKFEDRVKERLEEVRAVEADLAERQQNVESAEADLQTRTQVHEESSRALVAAQSELARGEEDVAGRALQLEQREKDLAANREDLDRAARQLEKTRASLDERTAQVAAREEDADRIQQDLAEREGRLTPKEQELADREEALASSAASVDARERSLAAAQSKLDAETGAARALEAKLTKWNQELTDEQKALDSLTEEFVAERKALDARIAAIEARETEAATKSQDLEDREAALAPRERDVGKREQEISAKESGLQQRADALTAGETALASETKALAAKREDLDRRAREIEDRFRSTEEKFQEIELRRHAMDARWEEIQQKEREVSQKIQDLESLRENIGPREAAVLEREHTVDAREKDLSVRETRLEEQSDLVAAKALEIQQKQEDVRQTEAALGRDRAALDQAHGTLEADRKQLEAKAVSAEEDLRRRRAALDAEGLALGEQRVKLTHEREDFEAMRAEKDQWIASKDIELEAREQSLAEKEAAVRHQAEENAKALADLAAREESLEIEASKMDKAHAELDARKADLDVLAKELEARAARLRDEEARKAEELRTWQTTLESEQALLKEQKETFEAEMQDLRESWAGRMLRVEQREQELAEREAKVQADVDWFARSESDLSKREKGLAEERKALIVSKGDLEQLRKDVEQRNLEVESHERSMREEAAAQSIDLQKRTEALASAEAEFAAAKAKAEKEIAARGETLQHMEEELRKRAQALDLRTMDLEGREGQLASAQQTLRSHEERLVQERNDLVTLSKQLEARQLELTQMKERQEAEAARLRSEAEAMRQVLAAKEADLRSERERLERESTSLQDKLGAKAKEMAAREKALTAREEELRSEEQDLDARLRDTESRERQVGSREAELSAQAAALGRTEQELTARSSQFAETAQKFETEAAAKRREWEQLQTSLKSQEARIAASAESRQAEISKRMEELAQREQSLNATSAQLQLERARLEAEAKSVASTRTEADESAQRSQRRAQELKAMEDELLRNRQGFEAEKSAWTAKRSDELKQLEATRDAAGEQTQQAERLIEDAQRRAYMATEAEKSSKRQMDEMAARQAQLEARRAEAEKAERDLQAQLAQFHAASEKLAARENDLTGRARDLDGRQSKLMAAEQANAAAAEDLTTRRSALDQEASRLAGLSGELERRQAEDEARRAAIEAKLAEIAKRDQTLATELQRADNLMEDLTRKESALANREKGLGSMEAELAKHEALLAHKDEELMQGMQALERMRQEHAAKGAKIEDEYRTAAATREEAAATKADAEKAKAQADAQEAEIAKNMRFLQKKALDVLDREEKIRTREAKADEASRSLEMRAEILEGKEKALDAEREELAEKLEKARAEAEKLKAQIAETRKSPVPSAEMEDWKRDIDNRVKIIQKKALELLDREEKLRKKEEELRTLEARLAAQGTAPAQ